MLGRYTTRVMGYLYPPSVSIFRSITEESMIGGLTPKLPGLIFIPTLDFSQHCRVCRGEVVVDIQKLPRLLGALTDGWD